MRPGHALILFVALTVSSVRAQPFNDASDEVFADDVVATVRITVAESDLEAILAPENAESDVEYLARFEFESPYATADVDSVGLRLRGNTSRYSQKKSFRVSFNTFIPGGDWRGLEKLNLNGEHNDPSIVRSKLGWDLFNAFGVPASRAAHVRLFINGEYFGLYINVEHVDEEFLKRRFGADDGVLYKCLWPADLTPGSEDACAIQLGADEAAAYDRLSAFITTVNSGNAAALDRAVDVPGFLRYLAVTVLTGSWDSYWFLKNNYYLYYDPAVDRFRIIPYDYDNTFGIWWEGILRGLDWGTRDVYAWGHPAEPRPLAKRILDDTRFRAAYTLYLRELLDGGFRPDALKARALALRGLIAQAAEADTYRTLDYGFTVSDFYNSYLVALADQNDRQGHVRYGLLPYIDLRHARALAQLDAGNIAPVISEVGVTPSPARPGDAIEVTVRVEDESEPTVEVEYWPDEPTRFVVAARPAPERGPDRYRAVVPALGFEGYVDIRVRAVDDQGGESLSNLVTVRVDDSRPALYLNELMALNGSTIADEVGEFDDWVEVFNGGPEPVSLAGLSLSDDPADPTRWVLPDVPVPARGYAMLWLDGDPDQGPMHGPFRLSGDGEEIALYDTDGTRLDRIAFGPQVEDVSLGRSVDGFGEWGAQLRPTPAAANAGVTARTPDVPPPSPVSAWPNPFRDALHIRTDRPARVTVVDLLGRSVAVLEGTGVLAWDGRDHAGRRSPPGLYVLRVDVVDGSSPVSVPVVRIR